MLKKMGFVFAVVAILGIMVPTTVMAFHDPDDDCLRCHLAMTPQTGVVDTRTGGTYDQTLLSNTAAGWHKSTFTLNWQGGTTHFAKTVRNTVPNSALICLQCHNNPSWQTSHPDLYVYGPGKFHHLGEYTSAISQASVAAGGTLKDPATLNTAVYHLCNDIDMTCYTCHGSPSHPNQVDNFVTGFVCTACHGV